MFKVYGAYALVFTIIGVIAAQRIFSPKSEPLSDTISQNGKTTLLNSPTTNSVKPEHFVSPTLLEQNKSSQKLLIAEAQELLDNSVAADIDVDGSIHVDELGQLIIDRQLRQLLDFYIGLIYRSKNIDQLTTLIKAHLIKKQIPITAQEQVFTVLNQYLAYRQATEELSESSYDNSLIRTHAQLIELRLHYLGRETTEAFFGEDESRERYALARKSILNDQSLSPREKSLQLQTAENLLPYSVRQNRNSAVKLATVRNEIKQLQQQKLENTDAVFQIRAQNLGYEAAERLATLDQQRNNWNHRVNEYRTVLTTILNSQTSPSAERDAQINNLRTLHFSGTEILRIQALDRTAGIL